MKKHIIFDFDDTISSSYELNQQLFYETFLPYSKYLDEDFIRSYHKEVKGISMLEMFEHVCAHFKLNIDPKVLMRENELMHIDRAHEMNLLHGVQDLLDYFKNAGKVVSLCTNRDGKSLNKILTFHNLSIYFDNIISCKDEGFEKPDPFCLNNLIEQYPTISKEETIYFGDSKTDAEFAGNAGIDHLVIDHYLNGKKSYTMLLNIFMQLETPSKDTPVKRLKNWKSLFSTF